MLILCHFSPSISCWICLLCTRKTFTAVSLFVSSGLQGGGVSYAHYSAKKNWMNSLDYCRSYHTDMAYVSSTGENSRIANVAQTWTGNKVWLGLFNDDWMWSDGGETSFRFWLSNTPYQENCASVAASQQGRWVGVQCNEKAMFVCQGGE